MLEEKGEKVSYSDYEVNVYVFAIRYAANRNTGAALMVVNSILANWDKFSEKARLDLKEEAYEATTNPYDWNKLLNKEI